MRSFLKCEAQRRWKKTHLIRKTASEITVTSAIHANSKCLPPLTSEPHDDDDAIQACRPLFLRIVDEINNKTQGKIPTINARPARKCHWTSKFKLKLRYKRHACDQCLCVCVLARVRARDMISLVRERQTKIVATAHVSATFNKFLLFENTYGNMRSTR